MKQKENHLIFLTELITGNKKVLTAKDREYLIILREDIKNSKTDKEWKLSFKKLASFIGISCDDD